MFKKLNNVGCCKKCSGKMKKGIAIGQTFTMGIPDFPGMNISSRGQTISCGGPGKVIPVWKCKCCGWSISR